MSRPGEITYRGFTIYHGLTDGSVVWCSQFEDDERYGSAPSLQEAMAMIDEELEHSQ